MRKVGYFFSGFLPILVATAIQLLATFFLMGIAMISLLITKGSFSVDVLLNMFADSYFSTGIMVIYSITCIVLDYITITPVGVNTCQNRQRHLIFYRF